MKVQASVPPCGFYRYPKQANNGSVTINVNNVLSADGALNLAAGLKSGDRVTYDKEVFDMLGAQGFLAMFLGGGADNDTVNYRVYLVHKTYGTDGQCTGSVRELFGSGTATFGSGSTIGGAAAAAGLRVADTLTWTRAAAADTPAGIGTVLETAYGSVGTAAYSPADNTAAMLVCPQTGWADGLIIELDPTGTTTDAFCLIARK